MFLRKGQEKNEQSGELTTYHRRWWDTKSDDSPLHEKRVHSDLPLCQFPKRFEQYEFDEHDKQRYIHQLLTRSRLPPTTERSRDEESAVSRLFIQLQCSTENKDEDDTKISCDHATSSTPLECDDFVLAITSRSSHVVYLSYAPFHERGDFDAGEFSNLSFPDGLRFGESFLQVLDPDFPSHVNPDSSNLAEDHLEDGR